VERAVLQEWPTSLSPSHLISHLSNNIAFSLFHFSLRFGTVGTLHTISTRPKKRGRKKGDPDGQIEAAIQDGLSEDKSRIDSIPVHRELADSSKPRYTVMIEIWRECVTNIIELYVESSTNIL
jgi:hypothetical protein